MSEAQGYLNSSRQELGELRHLAWKLEQMGRNRYSPLLEVTLGQRSINLM